MSGNSIPVGVSLPKCLSAYMSLCVYAVFFLYLLHRFRHISHRRSRILHTSSGTILGYWRGDSIEYTPLSTEMCYSWTKLFSQRRAGVYYLNIKSFPMNCVWNRCGSSVVKMRYLLEAHAGLGVWWFFRGLSTLIFFRFCCCEQPFSVVVNTHTCCWRLCR